MKNALYAQSGGVTSVINASAYGVIKAAFNSNDINNIYVAVNGINGVFNEKLADMKKEDPQQIELLKFTPSSAFGSCRRKIKNEDDLKKIFEIFEKYNIGYFFYNGIMIYQKQIIPRDLVPLQNIYQYQYSKEHLT